MGRTYAWHTKLRENREGGERKFPLRKVWMGLNATPAHQHHVAQYNGPIACALFCAPMLFKKNVLCSNTLHFTCQKGADTIYKIAALANVCAFTECNSNCIFQIAALANVRMLTRCILEPLRINASAKCFCAVRRKRANAQIWTEPKGLIHTMRCVQTCAFFCVSMLSFSFPCSRMSRFTARLLKLRRTKTCSTTVPCVSPLVSTCVFKKRISTINN